MSQEKATENKMQNWKIIYIPLLLLLIPLTFKIYDKMNTPGEVVIPRFSIDGSHKLDKDTPFVIIKPENEAARRERNLDIKIGSWKRNDLCKLYKDNGNLRWKLKVDLIEDNILKSKFKSGENEIEIGFTDKDLWDTHIIFITNLNDFIENAEKEPSSPQRVVKPKQKDIIPSKKKVDVHQKVPGQASIPNKEVNTNYYEAKGFCVIDREKFKNEAQAILMARKGASIAGKAELLEIIKGVTIEEEGVVEDLMLNNLIIKAKVEGVIKSAYIVGDPIVGKDMVEVIVRVKKQTLQTAISK